MKSIKKLVEKYFGSFTYFYRHIGYRLLLSVGLSIVVGILDGFGLSMFLPLLQMVDDSSKVNPASLGKLRFIIDYMTKGGISITLLSVLIFMCLFFFFKGFAQFIRGAYQVSLQQYFIRKIRLDLIQSLNKISYKAFVLSDAGRIQNTLTGEADRVARAYQSYFTAFQNLILVIVYMAFAFFIDARFALLVTIGGVATNFIYKKIYTNTKGASEKLTAESHVFQSLIIQHVSNFKYLKATGHLNHFGKKLTDSVQIIEENNRKIGVLRSILDSTREPLLIFVVALVIFFQIKVLGATMGPILISLLFFYRSLAALMLMQTQWNMFLGVSGSLNNMANFGKELVAKREAVGARQLSHFADHIEISNGAFGYGDEMILNNINLHILKNETVAFVGESGSGKTTLVNILSGLLPLSNGEMKVDGIDRREIDIASFQKRIGYITQDPVVFNDTIYNNVTFWEQTEPENHSRFWAAVNKASIDEYIKTLPLEERALLGANGINLSGGQKQRISIARELFKEADILILDEATSALDSETEKSIQENMDKLKGKYTILIVAHRLSTIKNADRIVLMSKGRITNVGKYQELISKSANFKRMVELQEL